MINGNKEITNEMTRFLMIELLIFFSSFIIAGIIATKIMNVAESIPVFYLLTWTLKLFAAMIPAIACMWAVTVLFEKPLLSMGLNLLLIKVFLY